MSFATAAAVVGTVVGVNALTGDPLGLGGSSGGQAQQAGGTSTSAADTAAQIGKEQWQYFKDNYQPLESNLIDQAKAAGTPEEANRQVGVANADVTGAFDNARKQSLSRMQSYGINPGSPAFQSTAASTDIAEAGAKAGAETTARNNARNLAYSKALDVVGIGRNIPAQSAASSANAANAATGASRNLYSQNSQNMQNTGYGLQTLSNTAQKWFGSPGGNPAMNYNSNGTIGNPTTFGDTYSLNDPAYGAKGGKVTERGFMRNRYARGGIVSKHPITPHMRFAGGGGVGRSGEAMPDESNMGSTIDNETGKVIGPGTGTSDEVPAQIDGNQPAALSNGEYVINKSAVDLTGEEMLEAINQAGLKKRQKAGIEPTDGSNDAPEDAGYADGGGVDSASANRRRASDIATGLRDRISKREEAQHYNRALAVTRNQKNDVKAIDKVTNGMEEDAELNEARARGEADKPYRYASGGPVGHRTIVYSGAGLGENNARLR